MAEPATSARPVASSYAAFISYSHRGDSVFAERLQREVERFAKPWNKVRAVRMFRDDTNLTASPGLWTSIVTALDSSRWLVLLLSPETAASHWCGREISHWLETHGSTDRVLLLLTAGTLVWDDALGGFDAARSTALPPTLADAFPEEPLWVDATWTREAGAYDAEDPRMQRATVDVAAAIRELSKDELVGTAVKEHRRTTRIKRSVQGALTTLLVLSIVAAVVALEQRHTAVQQRREAQAQTKVAQQQTRLAEARELAALSQPLLSTNLAAASTLAVAAYQKDADPATEAALFRATQASPHLVGSYDVGGDVTAMPMAASPSALVVGLRSGAVVLWRPGGAVTPVLTLPDAVAEVAQDPSASVVVASDRSRVMVAAAGSTFPVTLPVGMVVHSLAVTPDGRYVWVRGNVHHRSTYVAFDLARHTAGVRQDDLPMDGELFDTMVAPNDDQLVVFDYGHSFWARISARDGHVESTGHGSFGNNTTVTAMSPTGRYLAATQQEGAQDIQVWPSTVAHGDPLVGAAEATTSTTFPLAMALSPAGDQVAVADSGSVFVAQTTVGRSAVETGGLTSLASTTLDGAGGADANDTVRFLDQTRLVSVLDGVLTVWDLGQADRLGTTRTIPLDEGCNACPHPAVAVAEDGTVLSVNSSGTSATLTTGDGRSTRLPVLDDGSDLGYATTPLWDPSQQEFVLPLTTSASAGAPLPQAPGVTTWPLAADSSVPSLAAGLTATDDVVSVLADGTVHVQRAADGTPVDSFATGVAAPTAGAVSPDGTRVTVVGGGVASTYDVATHTRLPDLAAQGVVSVTLTSGALLTTTDTGGMTSWDPATGARVRTYATDASYFAQPVVPSPDDSVLARLRTDQAVDLVDTVTGRVTATLGVPRQQSSGKLVVGFSPDGQHLATLLSDSDDATLLDLRDLSTAHVVEVVCASAVRGLTAQRWTEFAGDAPYDPPRC